MKFWTSTFWCRNCTLLFFLSLFAAVVNAQSRIVGAVNDAKTGEPLIGVNVIIMGTNMGAATDLNGKYFIVNVSVGTYDVKASIIGYGSQLKKDVVVSSDRVTQLDFSLDPAAIQTKEVIVTAQSDNLHKDVSSTQMVATGSDVVNSASVRSITSFLERQPGVSSTNGFLTIRGGSPDQTGTMVNGLSFNNAAVGNAETSIPVSAIDQISLLSGGYNAEYGNFRSGLINVTTKTGSKSGYHGTFSLSMDNSHQRRFGQSLFDPHNDLLSTFLDPSTAFTGGSSSNVQELPYSSSFDGWINESKSRGVTGNFPGVTAYDLYLLSSWMFMTNPDYKGIDNLSDSLKTVIGYFPLSAQQKKAFADHARKVGGNDYNFDGGFGGPVPFISKYLGDATFYISNRTSEKNYYIPLVIDKDMTSTTLLTVKSSINNNMTLELNGLWKRETGVSPVRPAFGDAPDAGTIPGTPAYGPSQTDRGGFMPQNDEKYFANDPTYWYDPPFFPQLDQTTVMTGLTFNHVLSKSTYYKVTLNRLSISDYSPTTSDNRDTSVITQLGAFPVDEMPYGEWQLGGTHTVDGVQYLSYDAPPGASYFRFSRKEGFLHDFSKVNQYEAKFDIASQINDENYVKAGIQYNLIDLNHFYWEEWNSNAYNTYEFNYDRKPSQTGAYIQDQINYKSIVANLGVRFDYYYGGGGLWPSDPFAEAVFKPQVVDTSLYSYLNTGSSYIWNIWEQYNQTHPGFLKPIKNFLTVSPRLGISFPVTVNSKFYFNYGQFRSNPPYYSMYQFTYRYDKNGLYEMSNPNLEPPKTVFYELGVAYNFYQNYILSLSGYYKDITGQQGQVTYQSSDNVLDYTAWANNEYQDIEGLEINISKNDNSWLTGWINFNYRLEKSGNTGKSIISDQNINNAEAGLYQGNETRTLPRPELNASITFRSPKDWGPSIGDNYLLGDWSLNFYARWEAGDYFTYNPLNLNHVTDNLQYPDYYMVDMKLTKGFSIGGVTTQFYVDVSNVFNLKVDVMSNGNAFSSDGDWNNYLASLHLPIYNSPEYAAARQAAGQNGNQYIPGNDKVGDLKSSSKPYIDNPDFANFFLYAPPRDIWFGMKVDF
jgi:outer membrane receptor protein involved in Fe transport